MCEHKSEEELRNCAVQNCVVLGVGWDVIGTFKERKL
jgi:hypothetical protein